MFNIIYSEFIKLKKSYIGLIALLGALFIPIVLCISTMNSYKDDISQDLQQTFFERYIGNLDMMCFQFFYIILFALIAGYVFCREFTDKTENILYCYPCSRIQIFLGKFITIYIIILLVYIIRFIASYLSLYIAVGALPNIDFFVTNIKVNIFSLLLQLILIPIPILISNLSKNIIFPIIYGILGAISSMFMMLSGIYMQCSPFILPALPIYYFYKKDPIDFVLVISNIVLTFGISIILSILHYKTMDIK